MADGFTKKVGASSQKPAEATAEMPNVPKAETAGAKQVDPFDSMMADIPPEAPDKNMVAQSKSTTVHCPLCKEAKDLSSTAMQDRITATTQKLASEVKSEKTAEHPRPLSAKAQSPASALPKQPSTSGFLPGRAKPELKHNAFIERVINKSQEPVSKRQDPLPINKANTTPQMPINAGSKGKSAAQELPKFSPHMASNMPKIKAQNKLTAPHVSLKGSDRAVNQEPDLPFVRQGFSVMTHVPTAKPQQFSGLPAAHGFHQQPVQSLSAPRSMSSQFSGLSTAKQQPSSMPSQSRFVMASKPASSSLVTALSTGSSFPAPAQIRNTHTATVMTHSGAALGRNTNLAFIAATKSAPSLVSQELKREGLLHGLSQGVVAVNAARVSVKANPATQAASNSTQTLAGGSLAKVFSLVLAVKTMIKVSFAALILNRQSLAFFNVTRISQTVSRFFNMLPGTAKMTWGTLTRMLTTNLVSRFTASLDARQGQLSAVLHAVGKKIRRWRRRRDTKKKSKVLLPS